MNSTPVMPVGGRTDDDAAVPFTWAFRLAGSGSTTTNVPIRSCLGYGKTSSKNVDYCDETATYEREEIPDYTTWCGVKRESESKAAVGRTPCPGLLPESGVW